MQIADLPHLRTPSDPTLSPDGRNVVVALSRLDLNADAYRSELWITPTDGSHPPTRLTNGPRDTAPLYSPDGRWIAFTRTEDKGKPQLHVIPTGGGEARRLTEAPLGVSQAAWCPRSRRLAYVARVPEAGRYGTDPDVTPDKEPPRRITTRKYRADDIGFTHDRWPHVFVVDLGEDARPRQLTSGDFDHAAPAWSPDGTAVAFVSARHDNRDADVISDVFVVAAQGGEPRRVTDTTLTASRPVFVDDERLVFLADTHPDVVGRNIQLWSVRSTGAEQRPLTDGERWHLDGYGTGSRQPLLVDDGAVLTINQSRGALELVRVPLDGVEPSVVIGGHRQVLGADRKAGLTVALIATDVSAGEIVAFDGDERVVSDFGATLTEHVTPRPMTELNTVAPDGYPVHGWVTKPEGDGPFPVVLLIHGGPFTQYGWVLFDEAQVYAGAGYAVVMGNPRGASGYGEAHGRAIVGDMGNRDRADLLTLLDCAVADPALDDQRVGVMGGSYGGLMTTWLAGTDDRFRAAISERSVNVWDSFMGSSDIGWFFVEGYCGPDPDRQHAQSPLTYADGIRNPMLIIHSEEDWRCPIEQAQRLFERLKRNDVDVEMLLFPGEGHELSRSGLPSHRVARFEAIVDWWERHLMGHSVASGAGGASSAGAT